MFDEHLFAAADPYAAPPADIGSASPPDIGSGYLFLSCEKMCNANAMSSSVGFHSASRLISVAVGATGAMGILGIHG